MGAQSQGRTAYTPDEREMLVRFGERVCEARHDAELSQAELAMAVGRSRVTITMIESGRLGVSIPMLFDLAHALGTTTEALLADLSEGADFQEETT